MQSLRHGLSLCKNRDKEKQAKANIYTTPVLYRVMLNISIPDQQESYGILRDGHSMPDVLSIGQD